MQRNTALTRKTAGRETVEQVLAANIHWVFVLSAPTGELNPRRIERFLTAIFDSGARPAIMLTKADLVSDPFSHVRQLNQICPGVPVHAVSVPAGRGLEALPRYFMGNRTAALIGSSGVGKSTLLNHLAGGPIERVQTTRSDDKGKHTTTYRRLVVLPAGGAVVDTPGMRELQLWDGSPEEAFADVMALAQRCRFADCRHSGEPGCAVSAAVAAGEIAQSRIDSYNKLQLELRHIQAKKDKRARTERRQGRRRASPSRRCPP
jgi:ribosome biogenesis GTPase